MGEKRNSLYVKSVEGCERAGGCWSNIRYPVASIKNMLAQSVTQYTRLPSALQTHERNSRVIVYAEWGLENVPPHFWCKCCNKNLLLYSIWNYVNIHKVEHQFQCKGCNRCCSSQKSLSLHQVIIHRVYKIQMKQLFTCHICGNTLHLEIH